MQKSDNQDGIQLDSKLWTYKDGVFKLFLW